MNLEETNNLFNNIQNQGIRQQNQTFEGITSTEQLKQLDQPRTLSMEDSSLIS